MILKLQYFHYIPPKIPFSSVDNPYFQADIKEEGCMSEHLPPLDYARSYPSPDYAYYQRDYVGQDVQEKDIESRSVSG